MKLAVSCFCILHLVSISTGVLTRDEPPDASSNQTDSRTAALQRTGSFIQGKQRPLFARRGQYERQRIHVPKPKEVPVPQNKPAPPPKAGPKPMKPNCSLITQSCLPQAGCCDPFASCHCRFFNAICFCRRTNSSNKKKT